MLSTALGSLLIQKQLGYSDRELVEEITENPYFQYFIGLPNYQTHAPFVPSLLVEFRKRLTEGILGENNEMIIAYNTPDENTGTLILDATCVFQYISFPQDVNLLNEAMENLEGNIDDLCRRLDYNTLRMYPKIPEKIP
ncbi:MAG: transposase [Lachnospiraceae bacterium]|nr:transposase [Lachnospiraceae bacterium]